MRAIVWFALISAAIGCAPRRGPTSAYSIDDVEVFDAFDASAGVERVVEAITSHGCAFAFDAAPLALVREGEVEAGVVWTHLECEAGGTATVLAIARTVAGSTELEVGIAGVLTTPTEGGGRDRVLVTFDRDDRLAEIPVTSEVRSSLDAWVATNAPLEAADGVRTESLCGAAFCGSERRAMANACAHALGHEIASGPFDCCQCMSDVDQCVQFVADLAETAVGCERTLICAGQRAGLSAESVLVAFEDGDPATPAPPMPAPGAGGAGHEWDWEHYAPCDAVLTDDASRDYCQAAFDGFDVRAYGRVEGGEGLTQFLEGVEVAGGIVSIVFPGTAAAWGGISAFVIAPLNAAIGAGALDTDNYRQLGHWLGDRWLGPGPGAQMYCWWVSLDGTNYECNQPACMAMPSPGVYFDPRYTLGCSRAPVDTTGDGTPDCPGSTLWDFWDLDERLSSQVGFSPANDEVGAPIWEQCCESDLEYRIIDRPSDVIYRGVPEAPRPLSCVYYGQGATGPLGDLPETSFDDRECTWGPSSMVVTGSAVLTLTDG